MTGYYVRCEAGRVRSERNGVRPTSQAALEQVRYVHPDLYHDACS
jgi:hypothetical protein